MLNILVTGGAGYIGSHTVKILKERGFNPVVYDDLSCGTRASVKGVDFIKGDIGDARKLGRVFAARKFAAVMHFAAFTEVGTSVREPAAYYNNNLTKTITLLDAVRAAGVKYFIFSSSASTYGEPLKNKITESHPQNPVNPYGRTKLMVEQVLKDYDTAYGLKSAVLRYFNACGSDDSGQIGEARKHETHLIPLLMQAASGRRKDIAVFGGDYPTPDGTALRDYVHVNDLARAHILALKRLLKTNKGGDFNLGSGKGYSVKQIIAAARQTSGRDIKIIRSPRRAGDPARLVCDAGKAQKLLGWRALYGLDKIMQTAWNWELKLAGKK
ncbi:MAG: UDP-glucose 4-epimerase GalE [Elusimicrobiota bacterium]|jgi:UDP-glucose 4-epimerase|nr:UDP-glucose 4-epimerase GalE [Elusimicrobiota bacterium]